MEHWLKLWGKHLQKQPEIVKPCSSTQFANVLIKLQSWLYSVLDENNILAHNGLTSITFYCLSCSEVTKNESEEMSNNQVRCKWMSLDGWSLVPWEPLLSRVVSGTCKLISFFTMLVHKLGKSASNLYSQMKTLFLNLICGCPASDCQKMVKDKSWVTKIIGLEVIPTAIIRLSTNLKTRGSWGNKVIFACRDNGLLPFHSPGHSHLRLPHSVHSTLGTLFFEGWILAVHSGITWMLVPACLIYVNWRTFVSQHLY